MRTSGEKNGQGRGTRNKAVEKAMIGASQRPL